VALVVLVLPKEARVPDLVVGGGAFFVAMLMFNRKSLETEPAAVDVLDH